MGEEVDSKAVTRNSRYIRSSEMLSKPVRMGKVIPEDQAKILKLKAKSAYPDFVTINAWFLSETNLVKAQKPVNWTPLSRPTVFEGDIEEGPIRYILERKKFGEGGMGEIYRAYDIKLDKVVLIKSLKSEYVGDSQHMKDFEREAKTAARFHHPMLPKIYDAIYQKNLDGSNSVMYVMEYIDGKSLSEIDLTLKQIIKLTNSLAELINYTEKKELYHGDLKPGNIMLNETGNFFVLDFGLSSWLELPNIQTMYSPGYSPPERIYGLNEDSSLATDIDDKNTKKYYGATYRGDIYSFAATLYRLLFARSIFGENEDEIFFGQTSGRFKDLKRKELRRYGLERYGKELNVIFRKALAPQLKDRYGDVGEFADDLIQILRLGKDKS